MAPGARFERLESEIVNFAMPLHLAQPFKTRFKAGKKNFH